MRRLGGHDMGQSGALCAVGAIFRTAAGLNREQTAQRKLRDESNRFAWNQKLYRTFLIIIDARRGPFGPNVRSSVVSYRAPVELSMPHQAMHLDEQYWMS